MWLGGRSVADGLERSRTDGCGLLCGRRGGVDTGFVTYLAHTVNKPLYGWLRRNRSDQRLQDALDVALLEAVTEDREVPAHLLPWAGADPHRKVPSGRELGDPEAWEDPEMLSSSAEQAILYGRHQLFHVLRVETMPDLEAQMARAVDTSTLEKLVALKPPDDWSEIILNFIREFCFRYGGSSWKAQDALRFVEASGGRLTTISPDQLRYVRSQLLDVPADDFKWLLNWL